MKCVDLEFSEHFIFGKYKRVRFLKVGETKEKHKLDLIHSDVWGSAQVASHGRSQYYITFINDAARKV